VRRRTATLAGVGAFLLGLLIGGAASSGGSTSAGIAAGAAAGAAVAATTTTPAGPATTVRDGVYQVGTDIAAGAYSGQCPAFGYYARLRSSDTNDIISSDTVPNGGLMRFDAHPGEWIKVMNCTFTKVG
jgi:hypothetical protein